MATKIHIKLTVNGKNHEFLAEPRELLIYALRERLNLTGPHVGCDTSHCGACTVTLNGKSAPLPLRSATPAIPAAGA